MSTSRHIYEELGVTPVINAQGNRTLLGGNTPSPEVRKAMDEAEDYYVDLGELCDRVGEHAAQMLGAEAALITSGAAAALAVGAAAIMTRGEPEKVSRIPDTTGMANEFIVQRSARTRYDRALSSAGGRLVVVGDDDRTTADDIEAAIGPNTAGVHFLAPGAPNVAGFEQVLQVAHAHGLPVIVDAAGEVFPTEKLTSYAQEEADLVAYGAKYFGAVNSSGLLVGRGELVGAARANSFVGFEDSETMSFSRPMKIDRQEVVAVYAALKLWLGMNHEDRFARYEAGIERLRTALQDIPYLDMSLSPKDAPADSLEIRIDSSASTKTVARVVQELHDGNPSIWVQPDWRSRGDVEAIRVRFVTLKEGQEQIVAQRIREILGE